MVNFSYLLDYVTCRFDTKTDCRGHTVDKTILNDFNTPCYMKIMIKVFMPFFSGKKSARVTTEPAVAIRLLVKNVQKSFFSLVNLLMCVFVCTYVERLTIT